MSEWQLLKLGELITLNYGKALKAEHRKPGNVPVYSSAGLTGNHDTFLVNSEGIIVGRKGTVGKVYYSAEPFCCIDTAYYITPKPEKYNFQYLYYMLQTLGLEELNEDSAVPGLNRETAYNQQVAFPPLPEQKAIASVLSSLDDKIGLLHRQNKTLEAMAETLFRQWFIEEAKEDWEEIHLKELVSVIDNRGKTPPYLEEQTAHPIIEVNALTKLGRAIDYSVIRKYVTKDTFDTWFRQYLQPLDIVLSTVGSIGSFGMFFGGDGCVAQNIIGLRAKQKISNYFLYQWLVAKTDEIKELDIGSVQPSIKVPHLLSLSVKIPPSEKLELFDGQIKRMVDKLVVNTEQIQTLEKLRDTLLPKLMSGEVRIQYQTEEVA